MNRNKARSNGVDRTTPGKTRRLISVGTLGVSALLASAMLSAPVVADTAKVSLFGGSCSEISRDIHQLMRANPNSLCVGDLDIAAAHVEAAEMMLGRDKVWQALSALSRGEYELTDISKNRPHCALLAPNVKPILANLIRAKGEIEAYERLRIRQQATG